MGFYLIFNDFLKALGQLPDPRFRRVLGLGISLTIALLVVAYGGMLLLIQWLTGEPVLLPSGQEATWFGDLLSWGSLAVIVIASVFLMIPVASAITSLFLDDVAAVVEAEHYPRLPSVARVSFWDGLRETVNFLGVLISANVAALFVYGAIFWIPFAPLIVFYGLNGFLLGREYFMLAAMRRLGRERAIALRQTHRREIWLAGALMAFPLTIPIVNLIVPILGAATFTHIFHRLNQQN